MTSRALAARPRLRAVQKDRISGEVARSGESEPARPGQSELIEAVQRGDELAASEIYDRLIGVVDRTLYRVLGRREPDHRDLVQSTFEQIIVTLSTGRFAQACSLESWASVLASHVGLKALRSRRRERQVIDRAVDPESHRGLAFTDTERQLDARAQLVEVRKHLAEMNAAQAITVFLHDGLGHNLSEIAATTNVSVAAAQSRLVRGRRELALRMERSSAKPKEDGQ